jgi:hypothetical protein
MGGGGRSEGMKKKSKTEIGTINLFSNKNDIIIYAHGILMIAHYNNISYDTGAVFERSFNVSDTMFPDRFVCFWKQNKNSSSKNYVGKNAAEVSEEYLIGERFGIGQQTARRDVCLEKETKETF